MIAVALIAWIVVFLLGFSFIQLLCDGIRPVEKFGFALPVGMGLSSAYMFVLNLAGIHFNHIPVLLGGEILLCVVFFGWYYRKHQRFGLNVRSVLRGLENPGRDFTYYLALAVIAIIVVAIGAKALLWPVVNFDSVAGYDLLGKIIAHEGTIHNSVFDKINSLESNRTGYPPLYPYTLAFAHITGAVNPKITCIFFYVPMAICFYALLRHYVTPLGSALFTLLLISAPDYADFSSLSSNNTPLALYAGLGLICIYIWYDKGDAGYFRLGTALTAFGMWDRLEAVFFFAVAALLVAVHCRKYRNYRDLLIYAGISLLPFIVWELYLRYVLHGIVNINVRFYLFWDPERLRIMIGQIRDTTFKSAYWGIAINACLALIAVNLFVALIRHKKDKWILLAYTFMAWILYLVLFYQMDANFENVGWLLFSYKRGLYSYLPPLIFGVAILYSCSWAFGLDSRFRKI